MRPWRSCDGEEPLGASLPLRALQDEIAVSLVNEVSAKLEKPGQYDPLTREMVPCARPLHLSAMVSLRQSRSLGAEASVRANSR
jgi:hypothetical protein